MIDSVNKIAIQENIIIRKQISTVYLTSQQYLQAKAQEHKPLRTVHREELMLQTSTLSVTYSFSYQKLIQPKILP
jgi:hypothetical protein